MVLLPQKTCELGFNGPCGAIPEFGGMTEELSLGVIDEYQE